MQTEKMSIIKWIMIFGLAGSFSFLSFYQIIYYQKWIIIFTVILTFLITVYFTKKTYKENVNYIKTHYGESFVIIIISLACILEMYQSKCVFNIDTIFYPLPFHFFRLRWCLLSSPAMVYLSILIWREVKEFLINFWKELSLSERKFYVVTTSIASFIILIAYFVNPQWYLQYDMVYSIDSGWCYESIFPQLSYYDIRHPILSIITFPIYAIIQCVSRVFIPANLCNVWCISCIQIINVQLLIIIGFIIGKLSKSKWVTLFYFVSAPVLLFALFLEKYQICVFLLVLYVYQICRKEHEGTFNIVLASGAMPVSSFLVLGEMFIHESMVSKIKRLCRIAIQGGAVLVCAGRIHLLNPIILQNELYTMARGFGLAGYSLRECLCAFLNMVQGSFLSLSSTNDSKYIWTDIMGKMPIVGIIILIVIFIGVFNDRKEFFIKTCIVWMIGAFLLFVGFQWSINESPLFSIYFSWALIPLFQKGVQYIIDKCHWNINIVYPILIVVMFAVNISNMINISLFLHNMI